LQGKKGSVLFDWVVFIIMRAFAPLSFVARAGNGQGLSITQPSKGILKVQILPFIQHLVQSATNLQSWPLMLACRDALLTSGEIMSCPVF
jgi:hypothetical protein